MKLFKNKTIIISIIFFLAIVFAIPSPALAIVGPFGGPIISIIPCLYPFNGFYIELGPPTPVSLIYMAGTSFSYSFGPPAHPGQWLLGMAAGDTYCATKRSHGDWKNWFGGGLILYHGSSM